MSLEVRAVDHQALGHAALTSQSGKDASEHAELAPADEPVVKCLVRPVDGWRIFPLKPVTNDVNDAADDPAIVDPSQATGARKERLDTTHVSGRQQNHIGHQTPPIR